MRLDISHIRHNLEYVKLEMPYEFSDLYREFESETWHSHAEVARAGDPHLFRSTLPNPYSSVLKSLLEFLSSDEIKRQIIDHMYAFNPDISNNWDGWTADKMFDKTLWGGQFLRDAPGYKINKHIDTRLQIITMLMYFTENDDVNLSTTFYSDRHGSDPYRAPTGFCEGTTFVNDYDVWHEGHNLSNKVRHLLTMGLIINV